MKDAILLELAARWDIEAETPQAEDGSPGAQIQNAVSRGQREQLRCCADTLRSLVQILGDRS